MDALVKAMEPYMVTEQPLPWSWTMSCASDADQITQQQANDYNEAMQRAFGGEAGNPGLGEPRGAFGGAPGGCTITNAKDLEADKQPDRIAPELMSKKLRDW